MTITGNLGTVMKESATIALEYIKTNAKLWVKSEIISKYNIHLHVPEGQHLRRTSAGIAMLTSLVLFYLKRK
jgi:ATP-dependent Lon protease